MIRRQRDISDSQARELLRRLRDLCLSTSGIEIGPGETVRVSGCISADQPIERGVRYALVHADGRRQVLGVRGRTSALELRLDAERGEGDVAREALEIELFSDRFGRVMAPALGARLDLAICDARSIEHFLRRLIRAAFAGGPKADRI